MSKCSQPTKRKRLPMESFNENNSVVLKKTLKSSGFIRAIKNPTKVSAFHLVPIFLLALELHTGGRRSGKVYLLWNYRLSFSRHGRALEAAATQQHLECCVSTQPPSGGSHSNCAALVYV